MASVVVAVGHVVVVDAIGPVVVFVVDQRDCHLCGGLSEVMKFFR